MNNKIAEIKQGQRWQYKDKYIVEVTRDDDNSIWGVVIQDLDIVWCANVSRNEILWGFYVMENKYWIYLEGQDKPLQE